MSAEGTKQLSDFPATGAIANSDIFYSANVNTTVEQATTALQIQEYVLSPISNSSLTDAGTLSGVETLPVGRGGLLQTTIQKIANFVMSGLSPQRQSIPVLTAGQATYVTSGYTPGIVNIFIAGIRLSPSRYQALDGINIVITDATVLARLVVGMTVDVDAAVTINTSNAATVASVQALMPANQPAVGTLTGSELTSITQGSGLFQSSLTKIAQWVMNTFQGFTQPGAGAVSRTVESKLGDVVSILDFGADITGATDATASIQAALNFLGTAGGVVMVVGTPLINGNLNVPNNCELRGKKPLFGMTTGAPNMNLWGSRLILNTAATITLNNSSGITNLGIFAAGLTFNETSAQVAANFTGQAVTFANQTSDQYMSDCLVLGFNTGAGDTPSTARIDRPRISRCVFDCINAVYIGNSYDVPYIDNVHGWPYVTLGSVAEANSAQLKRNGAFITLNAIADYAKITNCFSYGWAQGFNITGAGGGAVTLLSCGADHPPGTTDGSIGFNISGSAYDVRLIGCQASAKDNGIVSASTDTTNGRLTVDSCNLWQNVFQGIVHAISKITVSNTVIRSTVVGSNGIYVESTAQQARIYGGSINVANIGIKTDNNTTPVTFQNVDFEATPTQLNLPFVPTVASANTLALDGKNLEFVVTGTTGIQTIQPVSTYAGKTVTLKFSGGITVATGGNIVLNSPGTGYPAVAGSTMELFSDGVSWYEISRNATALNGTNIRNFGVIGNGTTDDTAALQLALNSLGSAGGKLSLPMGMTCYIAGNLTIPAGVILEGPWSTPDSVTAMAAGPISVLGLGGAIKLNTASTITLGGGAGLKGLLITANGLTIPAANSIGFAGTAITIGGPGTYVGYCMVLGFNRLIYSSGYERPKFEWVYGDGNTGIEITACNDVARISNCHMWPFTTYTPTALSTAHERSGAAFYLHDTVDEPVMSNNFCYGYLNGYYFKNISTITATNCKSDGTGNNNSDSGWRFEGNINGFVGSGNASWSHSNGATINTNTTQFVDLSGFITNTNTTALTVLAGHVRVRSCQLINSTTVASVATNASIVDIDDCLISGCTNMVVPAVSTTNMLIGSNNVNLTSANGTSMGTANVVSTPLASADPLPLPPYGKVFNVTGSTSFGNLQGGWAGREVTLVFQGTLTVYNGTANTNNMFIKGGANLSATPNGTVKFVHNGTQWYQV